MAVWLAPFRLVLASQSAVRRALLEAAGIPVDIHPAELDERGLERVAVAKEPGAVATLLACAKARHVAAALPGRLVVGADQTLALGSERFSKPRDRASAADQLRRLAGRTHELHAAVAVARDGADLFAHVAVARLTMRSFSAEFLERYLEAAGSAVTASVGGYQLEALGVHLFERIEGDHSTILGLPMMALLGFLRREGFVAA